VEHVGFIGMLPQVGAYEAALRDDLQAAGADVGEGIANQSAAVALPLEGWVDFGVNGTIASGSVP
jgi:hypothetical protein